MPPWESDNDNDSLFGEQVTVSISYEPPNELFRIDSTTDIDDLDFGSTPTSEEYIGRAVETRTASTVRFPFDRQQQDNMRYATQEAWALDTLLEYTSAEHVGSAWTGNENSHRQYLGILFEVVQEGADEALRRFNETDRHFPGVFNDITDEWPWKMRTTLAGFIAVRDENEYSESVIDDLAEFASDNEVPIDVRESIMASATEADIGEGSIYADDPFEDDDLTDEEAVFVLAARLHGIDDDELSLDDIDDVDAMVSSLMKTGDYEYAIRAQYYGSDVPRFAVSNRDRPDTWETLDREEAIEGEECEVCAITIYEGEYDGGVVTVREGGEIRNGRAVHTEDDNAFYVAAPYESIICPVCADQVQDGGSVSKATYVDDNENAATIHWKQGVYYDVGEVRESDVHAPVSETNGGEDVVFFLLENGSNLPWDYEFIQPSPEYGDPMAQEENILTIAGGDLPAPEEGPIIFRGGGATGVFIDLDKQSSIAWGKAVMEGRPVEQATL